MSSVTQRINEIKQPIGGYINPSTFFKIQINDNRLLNIHENIPPYLIGLVVDYLTRYMMGTNVMSAFAISYKGAFIASKYGCKKFITKADNYIKSISGLDSKSIIAACKLVTFDVWYRNINAAKTSDLAENINPEYETIQNIKIMVERSIEFWKEYGPIVKDGFTFEKNGYSKIVNAGDGDFLTSDTLWEFKVSKNPPTINHTLQLLMYWIMGQHSGKEEFKNIKKLSIFNPRLNSIYSIDISNISKDTIKKVESEVICY